MWRGGCKVPVLCPHPENNHHKITNQNRRSLHPVDRGIGSEGLDVGDGGVRVDQVGIFPAHVDLRAGGWRVGGVVRAVGASGEDLIEPEVVSDLALFTE
jgi:hypothetical protein